MFLLLRFDQGNVDGQHLPYILSKIPIKKVRYGYYLFKSIVSPVALPSVPTPSMVEMSRKRLTQIESATNLYK